MLEWSFSDEVGGVNLHSAILTAYIAMLKTGQGQHVVTSQTAATLYFQRSTIFKTDREGKSRDDGRAPGADWRHVQQMQKGSDGKYFMMTLDPPRFKTFVKDVLKRPELLSDP